MHRKKRDDLLEQNKCQSDEQYDPEFWIRDVAQAVQWFSGCSRQVPGSNLGSPRSFHVETGFISFL